MSLRQDGPSRMPGGPGTPGFTRERIQAGVLLVGTALALWLCYLLVNPFLPAFAWALALAVVIHPVHVWIAHRLPMPNVAAGLSVIVVGVLLVVPSVIIGTELTREAASLVDTATREWSSGRWQPLLDQYPQLASFLKALEAYLGAPETKGKAADAMIGPGISSVVRHTLEAAVQALIAFFLLFFFFRDHGKILRTLQKLVPLTKAESAETIKRIGEMLHATIYGTLGVAIIQGTLGGLMFWWLGLRAPLLWGAVMGMLAIVPILGAFIIWIPAAAYLALTGAPGKALILVVWGAFVIGLIDNILYPLFVGRRVRLHTVPVFIAIVGGLAVFGSAGVIVGPVILVVTVALLQVWHERTNAEANHDSAPP